MLTLRRLTGRALTAVLAVAFGLTTLLLAAAALLAWRLSDAPLDVTGLLPYALPPRWGAEHVTLQIVPAGAGHDLRVAVAGGELRAEDDAPGQSLRSLTTDLALAPLLTGRLVVRSAAADGLRAQLAIPHPGAGPEPGAPVDAAALLRRVQSLRLTDAQLAVADGMLGPGASVRIADGAAVRGADGVLRAHATAELNTGGTTSTVELVGSDGPDGARLQWSVPGVNPAVLGRAVPALSALPALDATMTASGEATLGTDLGLRHASVHAQAGAGTVELPAKGGGTSTGRFASLLLDADGTPTAATLRGLTVVLAPPSGNPATTATISGVADRASGRFSARMAVDIDHVAFADLHSLWPERVGGESRDWLSENVSMGTAHDGHVTFTLTGADDGDDLDVADAGGTLTGDDVTIWWLRPAPPLQHAHAALQWQSPDALLITVTDGKDAGIENKGGTVRITGLAGHDQVAAIEADLAGGLADVVTLLRHPRLKLLSRHPLPLSAPSGAVTAHLSVRLPLEAKVTIDQVAIHAAGQVANAHLGGVAAGRDLDRGQLALDVANDGLTVNGTAEFARMPARLAVAMDFRAGPPTQVVQHLTAGLRVTAADADKAGLGGIGLEGGVLSASVDYAERRDGTSVIELATDLTAARLVTPLGWSKAAGVPGHAEGRALLDGGRLVGLDGLRADAPGLSVRARSDLVNGFPSVVHLERGTVGRSNATGTVVLPQRPGEPYRVTLAGPMLDLEGRLKTADAPAATDRREPSTPGSPYVLDLRFDRVALAPDHGVGPVTLTASGTGGHVASAHLALGGAERARADLVASGTGRRLTASTADLGALLRDTDLASALNGGAVTVEGTFNDRLPGSPFTGTLDLRGFKVVGAPVAGKLLQALTIYGVLDALRGPGLAFDRFETPFRLVGSVLDVENARAFSSSLGFTATGRLDFGRKLVDLRGTIVPAYFFNSLPGRIPLIGRIFSPEKGSGLFAANYGLQGALADPSVSINPLSALTPGFTRRFFDLFE